jgi:hypothetical protein
LHLPGPGRCFLSVAAGEADAYVTADQLWGLVKSPNPGQWKLWDYISYEPYGGHERMTDFRQIVNVA